MKDSTDITLVLDRTGSMNSIADDVRGGVAGMIKDQKAQPGEAVLTIVQFDTHNPQEMVINAVDMQKVPDSIPFVPRGGTPLLDALGMAIVRTGERLSGMPEAERPNKVVIAVYTDGQENASREYTKEQLQKMIKTQTEDYKWQFIFMGADIDSFGEARSMGLARAATADTSKSKSSVALKVMSSKMSDVRSRGSYEFTDQDRSAMS